MSLLSLRISWDTTLLPDDEYLCLLPKLTDHCVIIHLGITCDSSHLSTHSSFPKVLMTVSTKYISNLDLASGDYRLYSVLSPLVFTFLIKPTFRSDPTPIHFPGISRKQFALTWKSNHSPILVTLCSWVKT